MKYYIDQADGFYSIGEAATPREGWTEISEAEAQSHIQPGPSANDFILSQIRELEAKELMPRSLRDLLKKSCAADAAAIGMTLDQVYALAVAQGAAAPEAAKGWKKFKDFDESINELKMTLK